MKQEVAKARSTWRKRVDALSREKCVSLLERHGFAAYPSESLDTLRVAIKVNVEDGTIPKYEVTNVASE